MTLLGASGLLLSVSGDRGGFLRGAVATPRVAATRGAAALRRERLSPDTAGGTP
jgi:hypothetical protein